VFNVGSLKASFLSWLRGAPDDDVLRWLYRGLLAATVVIVALDYANLRDAADAAAERAAAPSFEQPAALPLPARPDRRAGPLRPRDAKLATPMTFDLVAGGRLMATGTIMPGTAKLFAAEVDKRGAYIKTVVLQSPGGSVTDALAMGRLIRTKKFATEVDNGSYCASACPLVFAGGVERRAAAKAAIGVHQVSALSGDGMSAADGMENAQAISAQCQQYLRDMGVDLEVWIHAMETPHDQLYYFHPDELLALRLATAAGEANSHIAGKT
jgi:hypothetical protein